MIAGTWKLYNLDFVFFFFTKFFLFQTFNILIPHLILNDFAIGSEHLELTVTKINISRVKCGHAVYMYVCVCNFIHNHI